MFLFNAAHDERKNSAKGRGSGGKCRQKILFNANPDVGHLRRSVSRDAIAYHLYLPICNGKIDLFVWLSLKEAPMNALEIPTGYNRRQLFYPANDVLPYSKPQRETAFSLNTALSIFWTKKLCNI